MIIIIKTLYNNNDNNSHIDAHSLTIYKGKTKRRCFMIWGKNCGEI